MASSYWIKLYHEILDDPKMGRLSDHTWRRTIEIFLIAGESGNGGFLPPIEDIAWRLRTSADDIMAILKELEAFGITSQTEDGWLVCNFATRQDKLSNAEKQRIYRERKHKSEYYNIARRNEGDTTNRYEGVTESNKTRYENVTFGNIDIDKDKDKDIDIDTQRPEIFTIYEHEIGALTPMISDELIDASREYGLDWCVEAIREAAQNNKRNWKYALAILKRWKAQGYKSPKKKQDDDDDPHYREVFK